MLAEILGHLIGIAHHGVAQLVDRDAAVIIAIEQVVAKADVEQRHDIILLEVGKQPIGREPDERGLLDLLGLRTSQGARDDVRAEAAPGSGDAAQDLLQQHIDGVIADDVGRAIGPGCLGVLGRAVTDIAVTTTLLEGRSAVEVAEQVKLAAVSTR